MDVAQFFFTIDFFFTAEDERNILTTPHKQFKAIICKCQFVDVAQFFFLLISQILQLLSNKS